MYRILIGLIATVFFSCAAERDPSSFFGPNEAGTPVVDVTLIVDQSLPEVYLRKTLAPNVVYTESLAAAKGATVLITKGSDLYPYLEDPSIPGRYVPQVSGAVVMPATTYSLSVQYEGISLSGQTTTPDRFAIEEVVLLDAASLESVSSLRTYRDSPPDVFGAPENQIVYQQHLLEARFDRIDVPAFQVGIFSLDPTSDFVIIGDFLDDEDYEDFKRASSSPPLEVADGNLRLPWFAIAFAGRHQLKIYALDDHWFNFVRTSPETQDGGFGSLAGDNFERPIFNIDGGIGLFGSASVDSLGFTVLPRNLP